MKLTKAQQEVIENARQDVDYARENDFPHWFAKFVCGRELEKDWDSFPNPYITNKTVLDEVNERIMEDEAGSEYFAPGYWKARYERAKQGEAICMASSHTIRALERMGLIKIVNDAGRGVDTFNLLNY